MRQKIWRLVQALLMLPLGAFADGDAPSLHLTNLQLLRMQQMTSYFENSTTAFDYAYAEDIHDGHGYTLGRVGFCTGTGDAWQVIKIYCEQPFKTGRPICNYLPRLYKLSRDHMLQKKPAGSLVGLKGLPEAWRLAARDSSFRDVQDEFVMERYVQPALQSARTLGLRTPIAVAIFYDSIVQHGGLSALIDATVRQFGQPNATNEISWLNGWLEVRKHLLLHSPNGEGKVWAASINRIYQLRAVLKKQKDIDLDKPAILEDGVRTD